MSSNLAQLTTAVADLQPWLLQNLRTLVEIESPSEDPAAVNRAATFVESLAQPLSPTITRHPQTTHGDVLELRFPATLPSRNKPVLLLGHLDTVWPLCTLAQMPWREEDGRIHGPGVLDMKAGVLMALTAIRALQQLNHLTRPVILLLNPDEEIGSTVSRPITETLAKECDAVFVLEPAQGLAYKTARKGVGNYKLTVKGIASHSGVDFDAGHSAILELMRLLAKVEQFTDRARGLTVNPGVIAGGTRSNVIAAEAWAEIDVRIARDSDAPHIDALFQSLTCTDQACTLEITGGVNRPPMERKPGTIALFEQAKKIAAEMGFTLEEAATGGGSDGNFTAALNIPTLDGMGAIGAGAHALHESILTEHLLARTTLLAALIANL